MSNTQECSEHVIMPNTTSSVCWRHNESYNKVSFRSCTSFSPIFWYLTAIWILCDWNQNCRVRFFNHIIFHLMRYYFTFNPDHPIQNGQPQWKNCTLQFWHQEDPDSSHSATCYMVWDIIVLWFPYLIWQLKKNITQRIKLAFYKVKWGLHPYAYYSIFGAGWHSRYQS